MSEDPAAPGPLAGVRVVEVASHVFVPAAGAILAGWGADVVKIEHPVTGDPYRGLVTLGLHHRYRGVDLNFQAANRAKRSVGLDLTAEEGRDLLDRLLDGADVFLTSVRPGARRRLRIEAEDLRAERPGIVYARGSGQGPEGPHADRAGYDIAAYWARSGIADRLTDAPYPPFPTAGFGDFAAGVALAAGVAAALVRRSVTGEGSVVDTSLLATGMWQLQPEIVHAVAAARTAQDADSVTATGVTGRTRGATWNPLVEYYRTRDRRYVALVMVDADAHWAELCAVLGEPALASDPRFVDLDARRQHCAECVGALDEVFARRDLAEWREILDGFPGAWAPVNRPGELADDVQVRANGYLAEADIGDGHTMPMVGAPVGFDELPPPVGRAPEHGEHTESVLLELGATWDEIAVWKERGVIV